MSRFKNLVNPLILIIMLQAIAFSQLGGSFEEQLLSGQMMSSGRSSMSEMLYIQQMLGKERQSSSFFFPQKSDSSNLFISADTAIGKPANPKDTLRFIMISDTIATDSLQFYNDIEEMGKVTPDGKRRIVLRKKRIPRDIAILKRYESTFFESASPAMFSSTTSGVTGNYPLKAGDELVLTVWGAVEKEMLLKINNQGNVNVESVGIVSLNGTTLAAAEGILRTRLSKVYSGISKGQTFVNLRLETLSPAKVFLLGEIEKPGGYVFHGNTTVFQAIYMAGGPNREGSVRSVQIARADSIFTVDLYDYLMHGKHSSRAVLFDGDIVLLPRAKILAEIDGAVGRPAIYELKEGEGVAQLISFAGGINSDAAEQNMVLRRIFPNGRMDFETILKPGDYTSGKNSIFLRNGDALLVFRSVEKSMFNTTILGAVKYPGTYQLTEGMTAASLVEISGGLQEAGYSGRVHVIRPVPQGGYQLLSQNLGEEKHIALSPRDTLVVYSLKDMFRPDSVSIGGAVVNPGYYQYYEGMDAKDLVLLAGGYLAESKKSSLSIGRLDNEGRLTKSAEHSVLKNYDSKDNAKIRLQAWDHVEIPYDSSFYRPELVTLSGAFRNPGVYSLLNPDETLESLIRRTGGFTEEAYLDGARFFRRSLAQVEIEKDTLGISEIFGLVGINISKSLKKEKRNNINLMHGDSIHIPLKSISVRVWGHVGSNSNVLWRKGTGVNWYLDQAGGVRIDGDEDRVMIRYANGSVALASKAERVPDPGSEIYVPYKKPPDPVVWTQIIAAVGTIAGAISTLLLAYVAFK